MSFKRGSTVNASRLIQVCPYSPPPPYLSSLLTLGNTRRQCLGRFLGPEGRPQPGGDAAASLPGRREEAGREDRAAGGRSPGKEETLSAGRGPAHFVLA